MSNQQRGVLAILLSRAATICEPRERYWARFLGSCNVWVRVGKRADEQLRTRKKWERKEHEANVRSAPGGGVCWSCRSKFCPYVCIPILLPYLFPVSLSFLSSFLSLSLAFCLPIHHANRAARGGSGKELAQILSIILGEGNGGNLFSYS